MQDAFMKRLMQGTVDSTTPGHGQELPVRTYRAERTDRCTRCLCFLAMDQDGDDCSACARKATEMWMHDPDYRFALRLLDHGKAEVITTALGISRTKLQHVRWGESELTYAEQRRLVDMVRRDLLNCSDEDFIERGLPLLRGTSIGRAIRSTGVPVADRTVQDWMRTNTYPRHFIGFVRRNLWACV